MIEYSWSDTELAYLAGIADGEGSLIIHHRKDPLHSPVGNAYDCMLTVGNTSLSLIQWTRERFGGSLIRYDDRYEGGRRESWKPMYRLSWLSKDVGVILPAILEYLVVKRRLAEMMLSFISIPRDEVDMRAVAYENFKQAADDAKNNGRIYAESVTK